MPHPSTSRTGAVASIGRSLLAGPDDARRFADRRDAGRRLAGLLTSHRAEQPVVAGMARGGVPVGYEVALALDAPLDVVLVRKIGAPQQPEFAIGALAEAGVRVINHEVVQALGISPDELQRLVARAHHELDARRTRYRKDRLPLPVDGRRVLLVDDGLATGRSARAAALCLRRRGAERVVLAVPVGSPSAVRAVRDVVDDVMCAEMPTELWAVGRWYEDFSPTSDAEVLELLAAAARRPGGPG